MESNNIISDNNELESNDSNLNSITKKRVEKKQINNEISENLKQYGLNINEKGQLVNEKGEVVPKDFLSNKKIVSTGNIYVPTHNEIISSEFFTQIGYDVMDSKNYMSQYHLESRKNWIKCIISLKNHPSGQAITTSHIYYLISCNFETSEERKIKSMSKTIKIRLARDSQDKENAIILPKFIVAEICRKKNVRADSYKQTSTHCEYCSQHRFNKDTHSLDSIVELAKNSETKLSNPREIYLGMIEPDTKENFYQIDVLRDDNVFVTFNEGDFLNNEGAKVVYENIYSEKYKEKFMEQAIKKFVE